MNDWKPGTLAMHAQELVVLTEDRGWMWVATGDECHDQMQVGRLARPLVVIDPAGDNDEEAIDRLATLLNQPPGRIRDALREFAAPKPPRPDEPQGLGAVVEDAEGARWTRFSVEGIYPWMRNGGGNKSYDAIDVVRVLGEGVSS